MMIFKNCLLICALMLLAVRSHSQSCVHREDHINKIVDDAAWCWFSDPRAVYHSGKLERIYYGYINSQGDVMIGARDEKTGRTETFNLHPNLQIDDHNVPSILFLPDGRLLVFYSHHNGKLFMRKSKHAEDITQWEEERILDFGLQENPLCYSHPVMLSEENNRIYLFFRCQYAADGAPSFSDWYQMVSFSDDMGKTWAKGRRLIDSYDVNNTVYMKVSSDNVGRIDILFTDGHPKIGASSVYHMYYEKGLFHQTNADTIDGFNSMPIGIDKVNKVYDVTVNQTKSWIWDIAVDENGDPVVTYTQYPHETDHRFHYARWDGTKWQDEELCAGGGYITRLRPGARLREGHYSGGIVLDHQNTDIVYLAREVNGKFEIQRWRRDQGKWVVDNITTHSNEDNIRPYVVKCSPPGTSTVLWMRGIYHHYTDYYTDLMMCRLRVPL